VTGEEAVVIKQEIRAAMEEDAGLMKEKEIEIEMLEVDLEEVIVINLGLVQVVSELMNLRHGENKFIHT
jgi:hypothetical protein